MRPDQHKKKASALYQKKHKATTANQDSKKSANRDNKRSAKHPKATDSILKIDDASNNSVSKQKETVDNEKQDNGDEVRRFSKRKVTSNWERYEEVVCEDEEEDLRGADFTSLLSMAGDASSQMRLHDEADWEPEDTMNAPSCLTIDCDKLASALLCIPLHRRLNIHESVFSHEDIEYFQSEADRHRTFRNDDGDDLQTCSSSSVPNVASFDVVRDELTLLTDQKSDADEHDAILDDLLGASVTSSCTENSADVKQLDQRTASDDDITSVNHLNDGDVSIKTCDVHSSKAIAETLVTNMPSSDALLSSGSDFPTDRCVPQSSASDVPSNKCVLQSSANDVPSNKCVLRLSASDVPSNKCVLQSSANDVPSNKCVLQSFANDVPPNKCVLRSSASDVPSNKCVLRSSASDVPSNTSTDTNMTGITKDITDMEHELDILLSLDPPEKGPASTGIREHNGQQEEEDWLDELLKE